MIELNKVYCEDCRDTMRRMEDNSVDSIVTDAPYEIGFMGKKWDLSGIAFNVQMWSECYRILKSGGYLLNFCGTRGAHRIVCAIEDAGFEIRDSILWLYGSGFPKSMNLGEGMGTALKPAHEHICVGRKPISEKTVAENVLKYGTGGINIDGCRIELTGGDDPRLGGKGSWQTDKGLVKNVYHGGYSGKVVESSSLGRFPANVILDEFTAKELDKQAPEAGAYAKVKSGHNGKSKGIYGDYAQKGDDGDTFYDDKGGASRFFYIAKADQKERNAGLYQFEDKFMADSNQAKAELKRGNTEFKGTGDGESGWLEVKATKNNHPTVKPKKIVQYLQKLVTPKGGLTYDPFGGSGTSALTASNEGFNWILSEKESENCDIANKRIYNNNGLFQ
jgi:DNA modification methylase